jgi:hypothetical protein
VKLRDEDYIHHNVSRDRYGVYALSTRLLGRFAPAGADSPPRLAGFTRRAQLQRAIPTPRSVRGSWYADRTTNNEQLITNHESRATIHDPRPTNHP